jgi:hypothetical protein
VPTTPLLSVSEPWYKRVVWPEARYIVLIVVGVLVLGAGAAYGIAHIGGSSSPKRAAPPVTSQNGATTTHGKRKVAAAINPGTITVAVLNGTTVNGLANQIASKVQEQGFVRGVTDNAPRQGQQAESVVEYAQNHKAEAQLVEKKLGIGQIEQIDAATQSRGADATVVVIVGADKVPPATGSG